MEAREFGERLRQLRKEAGLSQSQLAGKVGINFTYLSKIESGAKPPPMEKVILRLAEVLDTDSDELIALAGKVPSDIIEMLHGQANLKSLRAGNFSDVRDTNEKESFNTKLIELRKRAHLSQKELADKVGVSKSYLCKVEKGVQASPSKSFILKLAEVLNTDKDELMVLAGKIPADIGQILEDKEALQILRSQRIKRGAGVTVKKTGFKPTRIFSKYKGLAKIAMAFVLTCTIGVSLWYASPQPAEALTIGFPTLPSGNLGSVHSFAVTVALPNPELLPIQSIDLEIYNVATPSTKITCTS